MIAFRWILLGMRNVAHKFSRQNQKAYFDLIFFSEIGFYEMMCKKYSTSRQATDGSIIRRICFASSSLVSIPWAGLGRDQSSVRRWYGSGTLHPGQVPRGSLPLLPPSFYMFPLFTTRCLHVRHDVREPRGRSGNCGRECCPIILPIIDLLHAANLRHGTHGFTSPPKEGVLRIFSPLKNPTASAGFKPANLGTKGQHATPRPPKPLS